MAIFVLIMSKKSKLKEDKNDEILRKYYYDINSPGAFSNKKELIQALRGKLHGTRQSKAISDFLLSDRIYSTYKKRPPKHFTRRQLWSPGVFNEVSIDLGDLSSLENWNPKRYRWFLVCVCVFSHYLWVQPMRRKSEQCIVEAFSKILNEPPMIKEKLKYVFADRGSENVALEKALLKKNGVKLIHTNSPLKAMLAER